MKKIIIMLALMLVVGANASAQSNYKRQGNTFVQVDKKTRSEGAKATKTGMTWETSKGDKYDIYLSAKGRAFIMRKSQKTGNTYKQYLGEEVSREICKELGKKYIEK